MGTPCDYRFTLHGPAAQLAPPKKVPCQGHFGPWSACSKKCGGGTMSSKWIVTKPAVNGGSCPHRAGFAQKKSCNPQPCRVPVNCKFHYTRKFVITTKPANGGKPCPRGSVLAEVSDDGGKPSYLSTAVCVLVSFS